MRKKVKRDNVVFANKNLKKNFNSNIEATYYNILKVVMTWYGPLRIFRVIIVSHNIHFVASSKDIKIPSA